MDGERNVDAGGTLTRIFDVGQGEPLLLIHGGTYGSFWNAEDWAVNVPDLARHFRVIAYDRIGMGFTDNPRRPEDYVIGTGVDHAAALVRALGLGRVHVMGHSRGGYVAARLALEHPDLVDTLVVVDSSTLMTPANPQYDAWERESRAIADPRERLRYLVSVNSFAGDHITDDYLDTALEIERLPKTQEARAVMATQGPAFKADLVERQAETHAWIRAGRLTHPTLVVWAYEDPSATMERCGIPCMQLILPNVRDSEMVVLNRAGHMVYRERPEAFNHAVIDFIGRHGRG